MRAAGRGFVLSLALAASTALAAGCSGTPDGYGVHFALLLDPNITDANVKRVQSLEIATLSSVEPFYTKVPSGNRFSGREAEVTYRPRFAGGPLAFQFRVRDEMDGLIGVGETEVLLVAGAVTEATVTLVSPDSIPVDMGPRYDFIILDFAMPDLVTPPPPPDMARIRDLVMPPVQDMTMPAVPDMAMPPADMTSAD